METEISTTDTAESQSKTTSRRSTMGGTIFKRTIRGHTRWVAMLEVGCDPATGRRQRRTVYGKTMGEVREKIDQLRGKQRLHVDLRRGQETLKSWCETWLAEHDLKASSRADYTDMLTRHVYPILGAVKLERLTPLRIKGWHAELRRREVGTRTIQKAHAVLRACLSEATRLRALPFNPCGREAAQAPKHIAAKRKALEPEQVKALLTAATDHDYEAFILLGVLHGMRLGEIAALRWGDVDLKANLVHVRHTLVEDNRTGKRTLDTPKTPAALRSIPLAARTMAALVRLRTKLGDVVPHPTAFLFVDGEGQPIRRSNFTRRVWKPLLAAAGIPKATHFHDTRHTAGSTLLANGVPITTVSKLLGHANPAITLKVYSHALDADQQTTAAVVDQLYGA